MSIQLLDEQGVEWVVLAHDPASQYVNKLKRLGFTYIVLMRYTYRLGLFPKVEELPERGADVVAWTRLYDCTKVLNG